MAVAATSAKYMDQLLAGHTLELTFIFLNCSHTTSSPLFISGSITKAHKNMNANQMGNGLGHSLYEVPSHILSNNLVYGPLP